MPELFAGTVFENKAQVLQRFRTDYPQYQSGWGDQTLYSVLAKNDPTLEKRVKMDGAPMFRTGKEFLATFRQDNPDYAAMDDDSLSQALTAQKPELQVFGFKAPAAAVEAPAEQEPELSPFESDFRAKYPQWIGPAPKSDISQLRGVSAYDEIMAENARGRAGFGEQFGENWENMIPFYGTITSAIDIGKLAVTAKKMQAGEDVSDQDKLDLNIYLADQDRASNGTWLGKAGSAVATSIGFAGEFGAVALGGAGIAALSAKGGQMAGKSVLQKLALNMAKKQVWDAAATSAEKAAGKFMVKKFGKEATEAFVKSKVYRGVTGAAGAAARMGVGGAIQTAVAAGTQLAATAGAPGGPTTGAIAETELYTALANKPEDRARAIGIGLMKDFIERSSEFTGDALLKAPWLLVPAKWEKAFADFAANEVVQHATTAGSVMLARESAEKVAKDAWRKTAMGAVVVDFARRHNVNFLEAAKSLKSVGYDGVLQEMAEERLGGFLHGLFGTDGSEGGLRAAIEGALPSTDDALAELLAFSMPMAALKTADVAQKKLAGVFGNDVAGFVGATKEVLGLNEKMYVTVDTPDGPKRQEVINPVMTEEQVEKAENYLIPMARVLYKSEPSASRFVDFAISLATFPLHYDPTRIMYGTMERALASENLVNFVEAYRMVVKARVAAGKTEKEAEDEAELVLKATIPKVLAGRVAVRKDMDPALKEEIAAKIKPGSVTPLGVRGVVVQEEKNQPFSIQLMEELTRQGHTVLQPVVNRASLEAGESGTLEDVISAFDKLDASTPEGEAKLLELAATSGLLGGTNPLVSIKDPKFIERLKQQYASAITLRNESKEGSPFYPGMPVRRQSDGELFVVLSSSNGVVRLGKPGRAAEGMVGEPVAISKFGTSMEHEYAKVIPLISQSRALVMGTRAELESLSIVKGYAFEEVADKVREIQNADGSISELFVVTPSVTNLQDERGVPIFRWRPESGPYDLSEDVLESRARYLHGDVSSAPGVMESIRALVNALSGIRDTLGNKVDPKGAGVQSRMEAVQKIEALLKVLRKHKDESGADYRKRVDELFGKLALQMEAGFDYANYGSIAFLPYHGLFSLLKTDYAEAWAEVRQQFVDATNGILGEGWQSRYGNPFLGIAMVEPALVAEAGSQAAGIEAARDKVKAVKQDQADERRKTAEKAKAEAQPKVEKKPAEAAQPKVEKKPEAPAVKPAEKKPAPPISKPVTKPVVNKPPAPDAKELKRLEDEADALADMMGEEDEKAAESLDADKDVLDSLNQDDRASLMSVEQATAVKRLMIPMRYLEQGDDDRSRAFKDLIAKLKSSSREEDNRADALAIAEFIKREFTWARESVERYRDVALVRYRPREKVQAEQQAALDVAMRELRKAYDVAETPEMAAQAVAEPGEEEDDDEEPSDGTYNEANAHSGELRLEQRLKTGPTGAFFGILKDQTGENGMRVAFQAFSESRKALEAALSSEEMFDRFVKSNLKESAPTALRTVHQALRLLPLSDAVIVGRTLQSVVPRPLLHVARDAQGSSIVRVGTAKNQREYQLPAIVQREFTKIVNVPAAMTKLTEIVRAAKQAWMLGDAGAKADTLRALLEYVSTDPQSATRPRHRWARLTDRIRAGELSAEKLDTAAAIVDGLYVTVEQYAKQNQAWEPTGHGSWTSAVARLLRGGAKHMRSLNTFEESGVPKSNPGSPALETLAAITSDGELALSSFTPNKHVSVKGYMDEAAIHGAEREPISIVVGVTNVQQRDELDYLDEESSSTLSGDDKIDGNDLTPDQRTLLQRQLFDFANQAETNPLYFLIPVGERQQTLVWQAPRELLDGASFEKTSAAMSEAWRKAKLPKPATQKEATSLLQKRMGASTTGGPHPSRIKGGVGTHRIAFVADTKSLGGDMLNGGEILTQGYMSQLNYSLSADGRPVYHYKASVFGDVITKTVQYAYLAQNLRRFADAVEAAGYDSFTDDGGFKKLPADAERTSVVVNGVTIEGWKVAVPLKLEHETTNLDHNSKFGEIRIPVNVSLYGSNMRGPAAAEVAESAAKYAETALSFYDAEPLDLASKTRDYQHWTRAQFESAGADALWYPPLSRYAAQFAVGGLRDASRVKGYGGQYVLVPTGQVVAKDHSTKWPFGEDPYITDYPAGGATKRRALARLNFSGAGYRAPLYLIPGLDRAQLVAALEKAVLGKTTAEQKEGRRQFFALVTTIEGKPADNRVSLDDLASGGRLLLEDLYEGADVPAPLREQGVQVFIPGFAFNSSRTPYSPGSNKYLRFGGWVSTALDEDGKTVIAGRENALQIDAGLISRQSGDYDGDKEHVQVPHLTYDQALGAFVHSRDEVLTSSEQKPDKRAALRARYNDFFRAQDRVFRTSEAAWLFETTDTDFVGKLNIPTKQVDGSYMDVLLSELSAAGVIPKPPANLSDAEKAEYVMAQADRPEIQARIREIVMASSSLVGTVVSLFSAYQLTFQHLKATFPVQLAFDFVNPVSGKKESVRFDRKTADEPNDSVVMWFASNYPTIVIDDPTKNQVAYLMLNQDTLGMMLVLASGQKLKTEQEMLAFVQQFRYFIDSPFMRALRATEAREYARGRSLKITAQLLNPTTGKVEETTLYGDEAIAEIMRREGTWDQDAGNSVFRLRNLGRTLQSVGGALTTPSKAPNDLKQWMGRTRALEKALGMRELGQKEVVFEIPGESVSAPIVKAALATLNRYQRIYMPAGSALQTTPAEWGTAALLDYSSAPKKPVPLSRLSAAQLKSLDLRLSQIWGVSAVASLLPTSDAAAIYLLGHPSYGSAGGSGIQKAMPGIAYKLLQTIGDRNPFVQRLNVKRTRSDQPEVVFTVRQDEELTREEAQRVTEGFDAIPRDLPDGLEVTVKVKGQETPHRFSGESLQLMLAWYAIQHYGERGTDLLFAMSPAFHAKLRAAYQSVEEGWAGAPLRTRQETWSALTPKGITSEYSIGAWRAWMTTDGRSLALKAMTKVAAEPVAKPVAKPAPRVPVQEQKTPPAPLEELPASFQAKAAFGGPTVTVTRDIVPATKKGDADEVVWSVRQGTEAQVINEAEARKYWARRVEAPKEKEDETGGLSEEQLDAMLDQREKESGGEERASLEATNVSADGSVRLQFSWHNRLLNHPKLANYNKGVWNLDKMLTEAGLPKDEKAMFLDYASGKGKDLAALVEGFEKETLVPLTVTRGGRDAEEDELLADPAMGDVDPGAFEAAVRQNEFGSSPLSNAYERLSVNQGQGEYKEYFVKAPFPVPGQHGEFQDPNLAGWFRVREYREGTAPAISGGEYERTTAGAGSAFEQEGLLSDAQDEAVAKTNAMAGVVEIQELQSELFQKNKEGFVSQEAADENDTRETPRNVAPTDESALFLNLMLKDQTWVPVFIQSIVGWAKQQGFQKVRFPTGETAAKVEGHQVLADRLVVLQKGKAISEARLKWAENPSTVAMSSIPGVAEENRVAGIWQFEAPAEMKFRPSDIGVMVSAPSAEQAKLELIRVARRAVESADAEIQNLKTQGIEKLAPIEAFYEKRVGSIVKKMGAVPVTDANGNTWQEVPVVPATKKGDADLEATTEERASLEAIAGSMSRAQDLVQRFKSRVNRPPLPPMPEDRWANPLNELVFTRRDSGIWTRSDMDGAEITEITEAEAQAAWAQFKAAEYDIDNDPDLGAPSDFTKIAEVVEEWKAANKIVYNPEEAYAKGEAFYHDIGAFNSEAPGLLGRIARVLLNQQSKLRKGNKTWWKDTENQLLVSAYTAATSEETQRRRANYLQLAQKVLDFHRTHSSRGGLLASRYDSWPAELQEFANMHGQKSSPYTSVIFSAEGATESTAKQWIQEPVRPGSGLRFVIRPSSEDIVWAAVGDVYSGTARSRFSGSVEVERFALNGATYWALEESSKDADGITSPEYAFFKDGKLVEEAEYFDAQSNPGKKELPKQRAAREVQVDPKAPRTDKLSMLADSISSAIEGRRPQNYNELGVRLRLGNFYIENLESEGSFEEEFHPETGASLGMVRVGAPSELQRLNNYLKRAFQIVHGNLDPLGEAAVQPPKSVLAQEAAERDDFERNYSPVSAEQEYTAPQANPIYTPADRATVDALGDRASLASALWSRRWAANQARALGTPEGARLMHRLLIEESEKSEARQGYGVAEINRDKLIYGDTDDGILYEIIDTDEVKAGKRPMFARGARKELGRLTEREQDQAAMPRWAAAALREYRDEAGEPVVQNILKDQSLTPEQRRAAIESLFDKVWVTWGHRVKDPHVEQPEDPAKAIYLPAQETVAAVLARFATSSAKSKLNAAGRRDDLHLDWYRELDGLNKFYGSFSEDLMRLQGYVEHRWGVGFVDIETRAADRAVTKDLNDTAIPSTVDFLKENAFIKPTGPVAVRPTTEQLDLYNMLTGETFTMDDLLAHGMTVTDLNSLIESELHKRLVIMAREKLAKDPAFDAETYRKYLGLVRKLRESLNRYGLREWAPPMLSRKLKGTIAEIYQRSAIAGRYPRAPKTMDFIGLKQQYLLGVIAAEHNRHLAREMVLTRDEDGLPGLVMIPSENADIMPLIPDQILTEMGINWAAAVGKRFNPQGNIRAQLITLATETLDPSQWTTLSSPFPSIDRLMVKKGDGEAVVKHWIEQPRKFMLGGVDVLEQLMRVSQWGKMLGVGWSGFLITSIAESGIAGSAALTAKDNVLWGKEASGTYKQRGPIAALRRMRDIAMLQAAGDPEFTALLYKYARAGIQLGGERILDSASGVFDRDLNAIVEAIGDQYGEVAKRRAGTGVRLLTARGLSERYFGKPGVRGGLFQASKIYFTDQLARQVAKERGENWDQLTEESQISILRDLSQFINAAYGEDNWKRYLWSTPRVVQLLTLGLFAPQWTWAAFNVAGGGLLTGSALGNPMTGMTRRLVANNTLAMFTIVLGAIPAMLQLTAYMMGKAAGTGDDDDRPFPEQNEEGRKSYIDVTPIMRGLPWYKGDPTGKRRVYIRFGKQAWEVYGGWLTKPVATLMSKLSVPAKIVYEQVTGQSPGSDWTLEFSGRGLAGWISAIDRDGEKSFLKSRLGYIAQKYFPMSAMSAIQNQDASVFSFVAPVSHGSSAGKATADLIVVLNTVAEDSTWRFARRTPGVIEGLQGLGAAQLDAAARNGYDVDKIVTTAKGVVLGRLYKEFTAALNDNDTALMDRIANRILRVGGTLRGLNASVKARRAGANKVPTPEELQAIEAAMGQD